MLGSDGRLYDEDFDFDGDGKLNSYEYSVMDDVVFGDHDEVDDSEEEDDLEFDLAIAGLDRDELEDMGSTALLQFSSLAYTAASRIFTEPPLKR